MFLRLKINLRFENIKKIYKKQVFFDFFLRKDKLFATNMIRQFVSPLTNSFTGELSILPYTFKLLLK